MAWLVGDLRDDEYNGTDGDISMKVEAEGTEDVLRELDRLKH